MAALTGIRGCQVSWRLAESGRRRAVVASEATTNYVHVVEFDARCP